MVDEVRQYGAELTLVDGLISDAGKWVRQGVEAHGWFDLSTLKEPYRLEGKKTMGYELWESLDGQLPDVILYPTGGGTGLIGMWKAFAELREMGFLGEDLPRMVVVQSTGCAPMVRAFEAGTERAEPWQGAATLAPGIRVPGAFADDLILRAVRESGGTALAVPDDEILAATREMATTEGIDAAPEGGATLAALKRLVASGEVGKGDRVVLFNTGSGLKHPELRLPGDDLEAVAPPAG
jgi:threonine synthase